MDADLQNVFLQSMRRLAAAVSVITSANEDRWHGATATAVTSLCAEPASVLICLSARASLTEPLLRKGLFCVNLLQSKQVEISKMFGGQAKGNERFHYGKWQRNSDGVPFLVDAQANLFCRVDGVTSYGTHKVIIGKIESGGFASSISPLLYQNGVYSSVAGTAA
jgi:flavin reductase